MRKSWARISLAGLADFRGDSLSLDIRALSWELAKLTGSKRETSAERKREWGREDLLFSQPRTTSPRSSWSLRFWKGQCSVGLLALPNIPNELTPCRDRVVRTAQHGPGLLEVFSEAVKSPHRLQKQLHSFFPREFS